MKHLLLIEDDLVVRENTQEILELHKFKVTSAANGRLGIKIALDLLPDLIICDIMMPEIDGYGVLKTLSENENTSHIPFIFLSAKTEHKEIRQGMNLGADDYLTKPYEEEELINAISSRLAKAQLLAEKTAPAPQEELLEDRFKNLNELKNFFDDEGELLSYNKGDLIFAEGEPSNKIYLILKGVLKTYRMEENGKELTTALYKADDFVGFTSFTENLSHHDSAIAMEETQLAAVSKSDLKSILERNQNVALELVNLLTTNLSDLKDQLLQMAYSSMKRKTAHTILQFAKILQKNPDGTITISRYDLANVAGIAKESLIRTLSEFKKQDLIEMKGRNISILNLEALEKII
ncbi:response regulator [Leeuwenhoekiella sp. MAR_2009_132]|uniref:response regulator n=1 Tax=Leeuwenhoekiella sp. MAR_2009_132 TaxID=1392489 RepID=UPI00048EDB9E|nr:response regulator [Leeuwenhoekiella sp. MAR_2009_132]